MLAAVREAAAGIRRSISVVQGPQIALTAQGGDVPVTVANAAGTDVRVRVTLRSPGFTFPAGASRTVVVPAGSSRLATFAVRSGRAGGTAPIAVTVTDVEGREVLARGRLVVRSTVYPVTAVSLVVLAALVLVGWAVQTVRRRRVASSRDAVRGRARVT